VHSDARLARRLHRSAAPRLRGCEASGFLMTDTAAGCWLLMMPHCPQRLGRQTGALARTSRQRFATPPLLFPPPPCRCRPLRPLQYRLPRFRLRQSLLPHPRAQHSAADRYQLHLPLLPMSVSRLQAPHLFLAAQHQAPSHLGLLQQQPAMQWQRQRQNGSSSSAHAQVSGSKTPGEGIEGQWLCRMMVKQSTSLYSTHHKLLSFASPAERRCRLLIWRGRHRCTYRM